MVEVQSIKVSVPIRGDLLPRDTLPPEGAPGSAKATVEIVVRSAPFPEAAGGEVRAVIKAKSYREVLKKVDSFPQGAWAVLSGKLAVGGLIVQAGFTVQPNAQGGGGQQDDSGRGPG